jgi:hypothetical protein
MSNQYLNGVSHGAKKNADPRPEVNLGNVQHYVGAELSLQLYGPVSDATLAERTAICNGCEHRFQSERAPDSIGYCRGCGCGVNPRSKLSVKLTMPQATCPKHKWSAAAPGTRSLIERAKAWLFRRLLK